MSIAKKLFTTIGMGVVTYYVIQLFFSPPKIAEYTDGFRREVLKEPSRHVAEIEEMYDFITQYRDMRLKTENTRFVDFNDLSLTRVRYLDQDIGMLVNKATEEKLPVIYVNNKTMVGSYEERLKSIEYETAQAGKNAAGKMGELILLGTARVKGFLEQRL